MKQQFVVTHRETVLQETEETKTTLNRRTIKHVMVLRKYKDRQFVLWTQHFDRCVCNPAV